MTEYFAEKARDFDLMETRMINWNLAPVKFSLPKELQEKSNLVDDMEQDVGATKKDTDKVQFEIRKREKDLSAASDRATALREQFKEFEKMSNDLNTKLKQRADKLKAMEQREQTKKCDFDKEKTSAEIYVHRSKEMLGLVVEKAANSTVLVFTNVDKRDAERKFLCEFTIDGKIYKGKATKICLCLKLF